MVNPQKPLALAVDCSNCDNSTVINYQWSISDSSGSELQKTDIEDYIIGKKLQ